HSEVMLAPQSVTTVYTDACAWGNYVSAGAWADDLMKALEAQRNRTASRPTTLSVGGFPAEMIELTVAPGLDLATCNQGTVRLWPDNGPDPRGLPIDSADAIDDVYAVELSDFPGPPPTTLGVDDARRLVILARHDPGSSDTDRAELQGILDSIQIVRVPSIG